MSIREELQEIIRDIHMDCRDIEGVVVATVDGFMVATDSAEPHIMEEVSPLIAYLFGSAENLCVRVRKSSPSQILITTDNGILFAVRVGDIVLSAWTSAPITAGMLYVVLRKYAPKIANILFKEKTTATVNAYN